MKLFHVTTVKNAEGIGRRGFKNAERFIGHNDAGQPIRLNGVWFSDRPVWEGWAVDALPVGWVALVLEVPDDAVAPYFIESDAPYAEWCIPADLANSVESDVITEMEWTSTDEIERRVKALLLRLREHGYLGELLVIEGRFAIRVPLPGQGDLVVRSDGPRDMGTAYQLLMTACEQLNVTTPERAPGSD